MKLKALKNDWAKRIAPACHPKTFEPPKSDICDGCLTDLTITPATLLDC